MNFTESLINEYLNTDDMRKLYNSIKKQINELSNKIGSCSGEYDDVLKSLLEEDKKLLKKIEAEYPEFKDASESLKEDVVEFPKEILKNVTDLRGTPSYGKADYRCPKCGSRDVKVLSSDSSTEPAEAPDGTGIGYSHCKTTYCHCNKCWELFEHNVCTTTTIATRIADDIKTFYMEFSISIAREKQTIYAGDEDAIYNAFMEDCDKLDAAISDNTDLDDDMYLEIIPQSLNDVTRPELIESITNMSKSTSANAIEKIIYEALNKDNNIDTVLAFLKDKNNLEKQKLGMRGESLLRDIEVDSGAITVSLAVFTSYHSSGNIIL